MCERLAEERSAREAATVQLRHADRLTTVGKLASGIAHELGTPLNVVHGRAKLIVDGEVEGAEALASARVVCEQAERMTKLIRQLLDFARPPQLHIAPLNVSNLANRVCELVATIARKATSRSRRRRTTTSCASRPTTVSSPRCSPTWSSTRSRRCRRAAASSGLPPTSSNAPLRRTCRRVEMGARGWRSR